MGFEDAINAMSAGAGLNIENEQFIGDEIPDTEDYTDDVIEEDSKLIILEDESEESYTAKRKKKRKSDLKGRKRLLTVNFKNLEIVDATDSKALFNWRLEMQQQGFETIVYDRRNFIYCAEPTGDFAMLRNYYELLNSLSTQWVNYDLFDQGYLPYIYWPSFRIDREGINDLLIQVAAKADCEIMEMPASSLFTKNRVTGLREYWIQREQLLKLMDWIEQNHSGIKFGPRDIDTVSMVQFVDAFSRDLEGGE